MADEYTPTTEVERDGFALWLAAHDREVAAKALRDAADRVDRHPWGDYLMATPGGLLRVLADRIEKGASDGEQ